MSGCLIKGNVIIFKGIQKQEPKVTIRFNDSEFSYVSTSSFRSDDSVLNKSFELLPSIYCTIKKRWDDDIFTRYYNKYKDTNNFIKKLFITLSILIIKYRFNNQSVEIILEVRNKRDNIEILEGVFKNTISRFKNKDESLYEKIENDKNESCYRGYDPRGMYVDTKKVFYPTTMGGGAGRCVVWDIFQTLDLMNTFKEDYKVFDVETMLEGSSYNEGILELCSNYGTCGYLLEKFKSDSYCTSEELYDQIELIEYKGHYFPHEGKHRVCIAKRFKIPKIYAKVTKSINIEKRQIDKDANSISIKNNYTRKIGENDILNAYYKVFRDIGLEDENVRYITEEGLSDAEVINYIEKTTKKSLLELSKEVAKKEKDDI